MRGTILYKPVVPVRPAARYIGGKKQLAKTIIGLIAKIPHETYAAPFGAEGRNHQRSDRRRCNLFPNPAAALRAVHGYAALAVYRPPGVRTAQSFRPVDLDRSGAGRAVPVFAANRFRRKSGRPKLRRR